MGKKHKPGQPVNQKLHALRDAQRLFEEGLVHHRAGRMDVAAARYRAALENNPNHPEANNNLGNLLKDQGRFDEAMPHYDRAIETRPAYVEAHFNRSELRRFRAGDADLTALEALAARNDLPDAKAILAHFAVAKALEDAGDYERAFEAMRKGNALKRKQITYNEQATFQFMHRTLAAFDRGLLDRLRGEGHPSPVPVFVVGMPRSGSTLVEQILASHPQIHGAGELTDFGVAATNVLNARFPNVPFPECAAGLDGATVRRIGEAYVARLPAPGEGKIRIVDKLPSNFLAMGLIRLALPNARIIHSVRDPIDTCVSCYSKLFANGHPFTYDLSELGRHYVRYGEAMDHWRSVLDPGDMIEVSYEDIVDDLEGQARRMIDYCGLEWDERCVSFHSSSRQVKTASAVQVRQPLFRSSLQRWRRYESSIGPLLHELGSRGLLSS